jgi:membrane fusion protein, multidrug efflux system
LRLTRVLLFALVFAAVAAGVYWFALRPPIVNVTTPSRGAAAEVVYATGVVEPRVWAKVTPLVRERIVELCNCEGKPVERGAVLARLDDREAQATLAELQARLRLATEELERLTALAGRNIASEQALSQASSEAARLEAMVAGQTARLESYVLTAPMRGVVLRQDGEVGEIAEPGSVLSWVGQPKPLLIVAEVNEEDIPRVEVGQRALLRADAFPDRSLDAVVDSITPKGDPVTKTYRVRLALPETTPLLIGMTIEVNVVVASPRTPCSCRRAPSRAIPSTWSTGRARRTVAKLRLASAARATSRSFPASRRVTGSSRPSPATCVMAGG